MSIVGWGGGGSGWLVRAVQELRGIGRLMESMLGTCGGVGGMMGLVGSARCLRD